MDITIIIISITSFLIFLAVHFLVFRRIKQEEVLKWIFYTYLFGAVGNILFGLYWRLPLLELFLSFFNYSLLVMFYILGIFGMMESALRLRLLLEVYQAGVKGKSLGEITKIYNRKSIIGKRITRLINSGDLEYKKGYYKKGRKLSYFAVHGWILKMIAGLFSRRI